MPNAKIEGGGLPAADERDGDLMPHARASAALLTRSPGAALFSRRSNAVASLSFSALIVRGYARLA